MTQIRNIVLVNIPIEIVVVLQDRNERQISSDHITKVSIIQ